MTETDDRQATGLYRATRGPLFLLLAGYLLFAHGCHGHEDNELFTRLQAWRKHSLTPCARGEKSRAQGVSE